MPLGQYKNFKACVRANQDKRDPNAYCGEIYWKTEGKSKKRSNLLSKLKKKK